jgi:hypothetical protein
MANDVSAGLEGRFEGQSHGDEAVINVGVLPYKVAGRIANGL